MPRNSTPAVRTILLDLLDRCYEKQSWHGPNLKGSIRGLTPGQACWRPSPGRHSIAEHVLHAAYWKYTVRRRLLGEARGSFALDGSNWFRVESCDDDEWREHKKRLDTEHKQLRMAVREFPVSRLGARSERSKFTYLDTIMGIAQHDLYHTGQIQLIKRLYLAH